MTYKVRVWDLPTRLFHWVLVAAVLAMVITGQIGGNLMPWHFRLGYLVGSLLLFRLVWGFVGGYWSRFASFVRRPSSVLAYARGQAPVEPAVGHNPLGALSVLAMLLLLALQVGTGLFSDDEIAFSGPLSQFVSSATVSKLSFYHAEVGKLIILGLVLLHIGAILFYQLKKQQNLIPSMLHGDKTLAHPAPAARDDAATRLLAALLFGAIAGLVAWGVSWVS